ncbi:MAG TPA: hypothetical protein VHE37_13435 [Nevskiaceae bacterium]|nr:hypothetical protein [Nevskiaceae bacterium]
MNRSTRMLLALALLSGGSLALAGQNYIVAQQDRSGPAPIVRDDHRSTGLSCAEASPATSDLDDYVGAHFESLQGAPVAFPAQALNKLKQARSPAS